MTTLTFVFNERKVLQRGLTIDVIMKPIREYMFSHGAEEVEPYKFKTEGINAVAVMTLLVTDITDEDSGFINLLDKWILDAEGEIEDCIEETKEWYRQEGISFTA